MYSTEWTTVKKKRPRFAPTRSPLSRTDRTYLRTRVDRVLRRDRKGDRREERIVRGTAGPPGFGGLLEPGPERRPIDTSICAIDLAAVGADVDVVVVRPSVRRL